MVLTLSITFLITGLGCKKHEETDADDYYVKYELSSSSIYTGGTLKVVISNEKNQNNTLLVNKRKNGKLLSAC